MDLSKIDIKDLACLVYETLKSNGINSILVGGACVSIYSHNRYQSFDLDFVTYEEMKKIEKALVTLGFKKNGRCFSHDRCPYLIDFVNPPIAVGHQPVHSFQMLRTSSGSLQLLTPTDCVKDRLASYFHWDDQQALEQALLVAEEHQINIENIETWSKMEGHLEKFKLFLSKLKSINH